MNEFLEICIGCWFEDSLSDQDIIDALESEK
jgi:hypothetical protein